MEVYKDLFLYGSGIYERSYQVPNQVLGHQSVKIIGWGTENEIDYWVKNLHFFREIKGCVSPIT